jgi:hypothetical protein
MMRSSSGHCFFVSSAMVVVLGLAAGACAPAQVVADSQSVRTAGSQGGLGSQRPKEAFLQWGDFEVPTGLFTQDEPLYNVNSLKKREVVLGTDFLRMSSRDLSSEDLESCGFTSTSNDREGFVGGFEVTHESMAITYDSTKCVNPGGFGRRRVVLQVSCQGGQFEALKGKTLATAWNALDQARLGLGPCSLASSMTVFENSERTDTGVVVRQALMSRDGAACTMSRSIAHEAPTFKACRAGYMEFRRSAGGAIQEILEQAYAEYRDVQIAQKTGERHLRGQVTMVFHPQITIEVTLGKGEPLIERLRSPGVQVDFRDVSTIALHSL